jgi:cellulose synthase/poly-beta-1,6-N-acetylglucosamine synthase-like glycosyltransferase
MSVYNEASRLPAKLQNLQSLAYSPQKLEIIIASDGSTDETDDIIATVQRSSRFPVVALRRKLRRGKAAMLGDAIGMACGEILVFTDVRQEIEPDAIRELVANFSDPTVGCVSGELMLKEPNHQNTEAASAYWRFEKMIRKLESATGTVVGATGALYAVRRTCAVAPPAGTLLDDVFIPVHVARQGFRVVFDSAARVWDEAAVHSDEFRRKIRTLAGNYQLIRLAPWLLTRPHPMWFAFVSHKLLRLLVPFLLLGCAVTNIALAGDPLYAALLGCQSCFYMITALGLINNAKSGFQICKAASAFVVLNAAALLAPFAYMLHRHDPVRLWHSRSNPAIGSAAGETQ